MALQTIQAIGDGVALSFSACNGGGDSCNYADRAFLEFSNLDAATKTVTITMPTQIHGQSVALAVVVPAAVAGAPGVRKIKLTPDMASAGVVSWTYSAVTNLTVSVAQS